MTADELRVLEARTSMLEAMIQDLGRQVRTAQAGAAAAAEAPARELEAAL